jgi:hypothetical protein
VKQEESNLSQRRFSVPTNGIAKDCAGQTGSQTAGEAIYEVLGPRGLSGVTHQTISPRPKDLINKKIGLVDNSKSHAKVFLEDVGNLLRQRFADVKILRYSKMTSTSVEPALLKQIAKECDAVILGIGD